MKRLSSRINNSVTFVIVLFFFCLALLIVRLSTFESSKFLRFLERDGQRTFQNISWNTQDKYDLLNSKFPVYKLTIGPKDLIQINQVVNRAKEYSVLRDEDQIWVDSELRLEEQTFPIRLRIRGDLGAHWLTAKKSWRVKIKGDVLPNGIREFNLIVPQDKAYVSDFVFNKMARKFDILVPRDEFVVLVINGEPQGVYYLVEHPTKEMLAASERADGPIFTIRDLWLSTRFTGYGAHGRKGGERDPNGHVSAWRSYSQIPNEFQYIWNSLDELIGLLDKEVPVQPELIGSLLNVDKFLRANALQMLFGSRHIGWSNNLRLYYDPTSGQFEPSPWDINNYKLNIEYAHHTFELTPPHLQSAYRLETALLTNNAFQFKRNQYIWNLLENDWDELLATYDSIANQIKPALAKDPILGSGNFEQKIDFYRENLTHNAELLRGVLGFSRVLVNFYFSKTENATITTVEVVNDSFSPLRFDHLSFSALTGGKYNLWADLDDDCHWEETDELIGEILPKDSQYSLDEINRLIHSDRSLTLEPVVHPFCFFIIGKDTQKEFIADLRVVFSNAVTGQLVEPADMYIQSVKQDSEYIDYEAITQSPQDFVRQYPIFELEVEGEQSQIVLPAGEHQFTQTVIVPRGTTLKIAPGAQLKLDAGVSLISYSPVRAKGSLKHPIVFEPLKPEMAWGVLGIVSAPSLSLFENVHLSYTSEATVNGIRFTGGLAGHQSEMAFHHGSINYAKGDDGLNVKEASAFVTQSVFQNNASDAIDFDLVVDGQIKKSEFLNNGGDGIDLAGSQVVIVGNLISSSGDKGISIGERSEPLVFSNVLHQNTMALAIKDSSDAMIVSNTLIQNPTSIALYNKKPEFIHGGKAIIINTIVWNTSHVLQMDNLSSITVSSSNLQKKIDGENNISVEPKFSPDSYFILSKENSPALQKEGNVEIIQAITDVQLSSAPIGALPEDLLDQLWQSAD